MSICVSIWLRSAAGQLPAVRTTSTASDAAAKTKRGSGLPNGGVGRRSGATGTTGAAGTGVSHGPAKIVAGSARGAVFAVVAGIWAVAAARRRMAERAEGGGGVA